MKLNSPLKNFGDIFSKTLLEENSGLGLGTIASGKPRKDKYFPPTIEQVPSIWFKNQDVAMGQPEDQTDAPSNLLYPFESVFSELVGNYVKLSGLLDMIRSTYDLPTLTAEKKILVEKSIKQLTNSINVLKSVIQNIEQLTI